MVTTPHSPLIANAYSEPTGSPEMQLHLDKQDADLPPDLRQRFPVVDRDLVKSRYPDEWVAMIPTHLDEHSRMRAGRLVLHARDRAEFGAELRRFRQTYPKAFLHTYFTGRYPMGRNAVHV